MRVPKASLWASLICMRVALALPQNRPDIVLRAESAQDESDVQDIIGFKPDKLPDLKNFDGDKNPNSRILTAVVTATPAAQGGKPATKTATLNVAVETDSGGSLDFVFSDKVVNGLKGHFESVPPCTRKQKDKRQAAAACGWEAAYQSVAADADLLGAFDVPDIEGVSGIQVANAYQMGPGGAMNGAGILGEVASGDLLSAVSLGGAGAEGATAVGTVGILYVLFHGFVSSGGTVPNTLHVPHDHVKAPKIDSPQTGCVPEQDIKKWPICPEDTCKGQQDRICTVGDKKGCPCRRISFESPQDFPSKWVAIIGASFHVDGFKEDPANKTLQCSGPIQNVLEPETWKRMTKKFCTGYDMSKDGFKKLEMEGENFGSKNMKDWTVQFWAEPTRGLKDCPITCEDTFNHFMDDKTCYDSSANKMAGSGRYRDHGCGEMKYEMIQPVGTHPHFEPHCRGGGAHFDKASAEKKIGDFCGRFLDILKKGGTSHTDTFEVDGWRDGKEASDLALRIDLNRGSKDYCDGPVKNLDQATPFFLDKDKECENRLKDLVSSCKGGGDDRSGGGVYFGFCYTWDIRVS